MILNLNTGSGAIKNIKDKGNEKDKGGGKCLRTCASIVFSTLGVGAILISYIFCGAILFLTLEGNGKLNNTSNNDLKRQNFSLIIIACKYLSNSVDKSVFRTYYVFKYLSTSYKLGQFIFCVSK